MIEKIKKIFNLLTNKETLQTNDTPEVRQDKSSLERDNINRCIGQIDLLSKKLVNINNITEGIAKYSRKIMDNNPTEDTIHLLDRYLPIIIKLVEEHISYSRNSTNDLDIFWNNIKSKNILIRFLNKLIDLHQSQKDRTIRDYSAEISAFDSILRIKGY